MKKSIKIAYWVFTLWLALGMASTGVVQVLHLENETALMHGLGYPDYLLTLLGGWKILGVVAILIPRRPLIKEWAYAGMFFTMSGALFSHLVADSPPAETFPSVLLLALTVTSWSLRPADRKVASAPGQKGQQRSAIA
tara:strand:+ start:686 stop:1099 length:414 start_codon:yes stop_codon:yes gene_type:complete